MWCDCIGSTNIQNNKQGRFSLIVLENMKQKDWFIEGRCEDERETAQRLVAVTKGICFIIIIIIIWYK